VPTTTAPTLTTPRLILRPHRLEDFESCLELWQDPVVTRYTTGKPLSRQDVWSRLLRNPGHWSLLGFGYWVAEDRVSGRFVGEVGLGRFRRESLAGRPELDEMPEAGWVTLPWAHGQGYAHEAVAAALAWRDAEVPGRNTFCIISPGNEASSRLAGKLGFVATGYVGQGDEAVTVLLR
jgi:RimJ/RimL family protein N-acetyltransferase